MCGQFLDCLFVHRFRLTQKSGLVIAEFFETRHTSIVQMVTANLFRNFDSVGQVEIVKRFGLDIY